MSKVYFVFEINPTDNSLITYRQEHSKKNIIFTCKNNEDYFRGFLTFIYHGASNQEIYSDDKPSNMSIFMNIDDSKKCRFVDVSFYNSLRLNKKRFQYIIDTKNREMNEYIGVNDMEIFCKGLYSFPKKYFKDVEDNIDDFTVYDLKEFTPYELFLLARNDSNDDEKFISSKSKKDLDEDFEILKNQNKMKRTLKDYKKSEYKEIQYQIINGNAYKNDDKNFFNNFKISNYSESDDFHYNKNINIDKIEKLSF